MKILVSDILSEQGIEILEKAGLTVEVKTKLSKDDLLRELKHYEGLIVRSATKVTAEVIAAAEKLRIIGRAGSGLDNVDTVAATKRGIVVMNTPGGNTVTTAEHTLAMIFALARKIPQATVSMKAGKGGKERFLGMEMYNRIVGVEWLGQIGSHRTRLAQGVVMNGIPYDTDVPGDRHRQRARPAGVHPASHPTLYYTGGDTGPLAIAVIRRRHRPGDDRIQGRGGRRQPGALDDCRPEGAAHADPRRDCELCQCPRHC